MVKIMVLWQRGTFCAVPHTFAALGLFRWVWGTYAAAKKIAARQNRHCTRNQLGGGKCPLGVSVAGGGATKIVFFIRIKNKVTIVNFKDI